MASFTLSEPKRPEVVGSNDQVIIDDFEDYVINAIMANSIAGLGSLNMNGFVHSVTALQVYRDLQNKPMGIVANMSNAKGEFMLCFVPMSSIRSKFAIITKRANLDPSGAAPEDMPETYLKSDGEFLEAWKGDTKDLAAAPINIWFPIYYGDDIPDGSILAQDTIDSFQAMGTGYYNWALAAKEAFENNDDTRTVIDAIQKAGPTECQKYLWPQGATAVTFANNGPITNRNQVKAASYPQQAKSIKKWFLSDESNASRSAGLGAQVVDFVSASDKEKEIEARRLEASVALKHIMCDAIDLQSLKIENLKFPVWSSSMQEVFDMPRSARARGFSNLVCNAFDIQRQANPGHDMSKQATIYNFGETHASYYMTGNFQRRHAVSAHNDFKDFNLALLLPQRDTALVDAADDDDQDRRLRRLANYSEMQQDKPKSIIDRIGTLEKMEDLVALLVNNITIEDTVVDKEVAKAMKSSGFWRQLVMHWFVVLVGPNFTEWYNNTGGIVVNVGTHMNIYSYLEGAFVNLCKFATDIRNMGIYLAKKPETDLFIAPLKDALRCLAAGCEEYNKNIATTRIDKSEPRLLSWTSPTATKKRPVPAVTNSGGVSSVYNAPAQDQAEPKDEQRGSSKRAKKKRGLKPEADAGGVAFDPKTKGLFIKKKDAKFDQIFPESLGLSMKDPCGRFVTVGFTCPGCTSRAHWNNPRAIPKQTDINKICDHLLASKVAWLNKTAWTGFTLADKYKCLLGNESGCPAFKSDSFSANEDPFGALSRSLHSNVTTKSDIKKQFSGKRASPDVVDQPSSKLKKSEAANPRLSMKPMPESNLLPKSEEGNQNERRLVSGTKAKNEILERYQAQFGLSSGKPIVSTKKGEPPAPINSSNIPSHGQIVKSSVLKPTKDASYLVDGLMLHNVIVPVLAQRRSSFHQKDIKSLSLINKAFRRAVPRIAHLLDTDFLPILRERDGYAEQAEIDPQRVEMATAAFVACGLDPGKLVRLLNRQFTGEDRRVKEILREARRSGISQEDYQHIKRILTRGCPARLVHLERQEDKIRMMKRGNQKSLLDNPEIERQALNKEDKNSHVIVLEDWVCLFSPYSRHTTQGLVLKAGKNPRWVWDGSTMITPWDKVMNEITSTELEAEITFGNVEQLFLRHLYNLRVTYPNLEIFIATADIKACFRFPRVCPDLAGAFGFFAQGFYCLATAMVFGSNTSATSWEPFRRAIEGLSVVYANREDLVEKHAQYLDMIGWDLRRTAAITKAVPCAMNPGVLDEDGNEIPEPARFYVDDALMATCGVKKMKMALAAVIEAIFAIMGDPDTKVRQCPLALDKWQELVAGPSQLALGLRFHSRTLTVEILEEYREKVLDTLNTTWHAGRRQFTAPEAACLVGMLARLAKGAPWVWHMLCQFYSSLAWALKQIREFYDDSPDSFKAVVADLEAKNFCCSSRVSQEKVIRFALKKAARAVHHSKLRFNIVETMRSEIEFFREKLQLGSGISWHAPIAHLIKRMPLGKFFGNACLDGAGGYSIELNVWWHVAFPDEIVQRTLLYLPNNGDDKLISINVLEFITIIISYCAALTVLTNENITDDPFPVLLIVTDNTSAQNWTNHTCKRSRIGRLLARVFCSLLIGSRLGINSKWISTEDNEVADQISRLRKEFKANSPSKHFSFDYHNLKQKYTELKHCRSFQPSRELLSLIWETVLTGRSPTHEQVQTLKRSGLGKIEP